MKERFIAFFIIAVLLFFVTSCANSLPANSVFATAETQTESSPKQAEEKVMDELSREPVVGSLPDYHYTGEDLYLEAVCAYFSERAPEREDDTLYMPAPYILKTEKKDGEILIYGQFWDFWYELRGTTLLCVSGGENTGRLHLTEQDGSVKVTTFEQVRDGGDYIVDLKRICGDDMELYENFMEPQGFTEPKWEPIRRELIIRYAKDHHLDIEFCQDSGWPPVPLEEPSDTASAVSGRDIYRLLSGSGIGNSPEVSAFLDQDYTCVNKTMYVQANMLNARILPSTEFEQSYVVLQLPKGSRIEIIYQGTEWSGFYQTSENQDTILWVKNKYLSEQRLE